MNPSRPTTIIASIALVFAMTGTIFTLRLIDAMPLKAGRQDSLYIESAKVLRRISLGYTGLLADIYWTRAVQYFGYQHHQNSRDFHLLAPLLQIATELDPRMAPAYQFGTDFLAQEPPNGAGRPGEAVALLNYGIEHNPDQWRLYYNLGFLYFTEFKDYGKAAEAFAKGAQLPVTSPFMPVLAARMAQHAGEFDTARMLWRTAYESAKDPSIRQNAIDHLLALRIDEDVSNLENIVKAYRAKTGHLPERIADMESAGLIRGTPTDPNGKAYKLMPDGRIEVQNAGSIFYITKGLPPGMSSPRPRTAMVQ